MSADLQTPPISQPFGSYREMPFDPPPIVVSTIPTVRSAELVAVAAWLILSEILVWPSGWGLGVALFVALTPALLWFASDARVRSPRQVAITSLLAVMAMRLVWQPSAGALMLSATLLFAFAVSLRDRHTHVPDVAAAMPVSLLWSLPMSLHFAASVRQRAAPGGAKAKRWREVVVPLAVVAGFGLVFTAANPLVSRAVTKVLDRAFSLRGVPSFGHLAFWAVSILASLALLRPLLNRPSTTSVVDPTDALAPTAAPATDSHTATARNVLLGLNALFLAHNALDAVYLWAGNLPPGIGHTQYAHEGAFWLTVALGMSTAVLGWVFHGMTRDDPASGGLRALAYVWAAQNLVLSAGTFARIWKYVDFSGLTTLRLFGVAGSALVAVSFAMIVKKVHSDRSLAWLVRRDLDAVVVALVLFTALPTDAWVSGFNAARIKRAEYRPLLHLIQQEMTAESVEGMLPLLQHPDPVVRDGVAARLLRLRDTLRREQAQSTHWTARSLARERALRLLSATEVGHGRGVEAIDALEGDTSRRSGVESAFQRRAWESNDQNVSREL